MKNKEKSVRHHLSAIGVCFAENLTHDLRDKADIEVALLEAAFEIGCGSDPKLLSPVLSWISIHGERVNMERLRKLKNKIESDDSHCWIAAFAFFGLSCKQTRWKILAKNPPCPKATVDLDFAKMLAKRKGIETWAKGTNFLVPLNSEPILEKYALSPEQLAPLCRQYRNRLIFGTSWRADIVTAIESGAKNAMEASKICGSAYEPAQRVFAELKLASYLRV